MPESFHLHKMAIPILAIFLVNVKHMGPQSKSPYTQKVEFLWVRWFGRDLEYAAGWSARRLHRVGFLPPDVPGAFGFLDPAEVIRGVHMIPAFAYETTNELGLGESIACQAGDNEDWQYFYVSM